MMELAVSLILVKTVTFLLLERIVNCLSSILLQPQTSYRVQTDYKQSSCLDI